MNTNAVMIIGNWSFNACEKGLSIFFYDKVTGKLMPSETILNDVSVGRQYLDKDRGILYVTDERGDRRGEIGGGGYLIALRINAKTGRLTIMNEKETLGSKPSYVWLDYSKKYLLVCHHCGGGHVTKIVKRDDAFGSETVFDDTALVLFRLNEDGSLAEVSDVYISEGNGGKSKKPRSRQHSIISSPDGDIFFVCDKGIDKIYTFKLDREKGKIIFLHEIHTEEGSAPRYGAVHPSKPIFYLVHEKKDFIGVYNYNKNTGEMQLVKYCSVISDEKRKQKIEPADISFSLNFEKLYVSIRGADLIAVFCLDNDGIPVLCENVSCGGVNPRGLNISPDGKYLFVANTDSGSVCFFDEVKGKLRLLGNAAKCPCPANISIYEE
jgi:6-phosphogluconolactonase (cycloisomerase 2 family)